MDPSSQEFSPKQRDSYKTNFTERNTAHALIIQNQIREIAVLGVPQIADPDRCFLSRMLWVVLVTFGAGLAVYQIQDRIVYFLSYSTTTSYTYQHTEDLYFPQVTICNENKMSKTAAEKYGISEDLEHMYPHFFVPGMELANTTRLRDLNYTQDEWEKIRVDLAQPADEAVPFQFTFDYKRLTAENVTVVETDMGLCFALNTDGKTLKMSQPGAAFGLIMILYINQPNYWVTNSYSAGFRVMLHDPAEPPLLKRYGFFVSPGTTSAVSMEVEKITELGPPYSQCNDDPSYRRDSCELKCVMEQIFQGCGCRPYYMPGPYRTCTILEDYECSEPLFNKYSAEGYNNCSCPRQCYSNNYRYSISQSATSERFKTFVSDNYEGITPEVLDRDYTVISIYYSSLQYTDISTSPSYEAMALLSDIGGALGLLLGATLLTLFQMVECIVEVIKYYR